MPKAIVIVEGETNMNRQQYKSIANQLYCYHWKNRRVLECERRYIFITFDISAHLPTEWILQISRLVHLFVYIFSLYLCIIILRCSFLFDSLRHILKFMERNLLSKRVITLEAAMEGSIDVDFFFMLACVMMAV